ncbi:hypothetical protein F4808DRAFT_462282 [Astrocystis sublimbata]|nr:hypothetical protein F4808DRAFT_462282 [Astrocystis sublimbata]
MPGVAKSFGMAPEIDDDTDYGSDFSAGEEQLVEQILADLASNTNSNSPRASTSTSATATATITTTRTANATTTIATTFTNTRPNHSGHYDASTPTQVGDEPSFTTEVPGPIRALSTPNDTTASASRLEHDAMSLDPVEPAEPVAYPDLSRALISLEPETPVPTTRKQPKEKKGPDTRTPLQRFRSFPKRPLTVTDLAAGAWCELQHWYTLTRLPGGRKTITPAMRGGTKVHQKLEDEVHTTVQVDIVSREEAFALRLWNLVQGLRTLRDTGKTRELEVWGVMEGEFFNGVIDQLSHESPNASFEEELDLAGSTEENQTKQQASIMDYLGTSHMRVYLTDVKTRGSDRLPSGPALRPARVQLFLYHRLISDMATDKLDFAAIFHRYGLNTEARFSDGFIAQIGGLHDEIFYDADTDVSPSSSSETTARTETEVPDLIGYRSLSQIIPLICAELRATFPRGAASIGDLLSVEYRHRETERVLGNNSFPNDPEALEGFLKDNLKWWRGEREPQGVAIEETYKCHWCEFAEACDWRTEKEAEFLESKRKEKEKVEGEAGVGLG